MIEIPERLTVHAIGRPAPQGSKRLGAAGQMREQSVYLKPWRAAVERAAYAAFNELGIDPKQLPLYRGPVGITVVFRLDPTQPIAGPPDLDKLLRSTWDALTRARVWSDDALVCQASAFKVRAGGFHAVEPGAEIEITDLVRGQR